MLLKLFLSGENCPFWQKIKNYRFSSYLDWNHVQICQIRICPALGIYFTIFCNFSTLKSHPLWRNIWKKVAYNSFKLCKAFVMNLNPLNVCKVISQLCKGFNPSEPSQIDENIFLKQLGSFMGYIYKKLKSPFYLWH